VCTRVSEVVAARQPSLVLRRDKYSGPQQSGSSGGATRRNLFERATKIRGNFRRQIAQKAAAIASGNEFHHVNISVSSKRQATRGTQLHVSDGPRTVMDGQFVLQDVIRTDREALIQQLGFVTQFV